MIGELDELEKGAKISQAVASAGSGNGLNPKEVAKVKEMIDKFPHMEETFQKILTDMKNMNL